jgi:hypothetical protein
MGVPRAKTPVTDLPWAMIASGGRMQSDRTGLKFGRATATCCVKRIDPSLSRSAFGPGVVDLPTSAGVAILAWDGSRSAARAMAAVPVVARMSDAGGRRPNRADPRSISANEARPASILIHVGCFLEDPGRCVEAIVKPSPGPGHRRLSAPGRLPTGLGPKAPFATIKTPARRAVRSV